MKTIILTIVLIATTILSYAQSGKLDNKWYSTAEVDFVFPNKFLYAYHTERGGTDDELEPQGFLLKSFGAQYTYNYLFFNKLSVGALAGVQTLSYPKDYFMLKVGGIIKYFFAGRDNVYIYTQVAHNFSTDNSKFKKGGSGRLGIGLPVIKRGNFNITTNIFTQRISLDLRNADPIYGFEGEIPMRLTMEGSFGISFGVQF